jgi:hypothetical protein
LLAAPLWAAEFRAGRAAVKITPPAGIPMAGYYSIRLAEGTHDDLYAKALVLDKDGAAAALVACDLVSIDAGVVAEARRLVTKLTGIAEERVMISATHSHTGPLLNHRFLAAADPAARKLAEQYRAALPGKLAEAVKLAQASLSPARVFSGSGHEPSISFYRRFLMKDGSVRTNPGKLNPEIVQPMGEIDPEVDLLWFTGADARPLAAYLNFALHLDTVGGTQFSADYPYTLAKILGKLHGPELLTLFTIGAAGNINHVDVKSREAQKGHAEAQRIGTILAGEALKTLARLQPVNTDSLRSAQETLALPAQRFSAAEAAKARETAAGFGRNSRATPEMVHAFKVLDAAERKGTIEAEVQVIALGDRVAWVGLPGEIFVELGVAVKKASPFPQTIVVSLANGSLSYVPTKKAFSEGGYEVISARCQAGGGEALAETAIRLLARLHRAAPR